MSSISNNPNIFSLANVNSFMEALKDFRGKSGLTPDEYHATAFQLEEVLSMSNGELEEIVLEGVTSDDIVAWRNMFYEGMRRGDYPVQISSRNLWAYNEEFSSFRSEPIEGDKFIALFSGLAAPASQQTFEDCMHTLYQLYTLHEILLFRPDNQVKQIFSILLHCQVARIIALKPEFQNKSYFLLDLPEGLKLPIHLEESFNGLKFCCYKMADGRWRVGVTHAFQDTLLRVARFNANNTQMLILDNKNTLINRSCVIIEADIPPRTNLIWINNIRVSLSYCKSPKGFWEGGRNTSSFVFGINPRLPTPFIQEFLQDTVFAHDPDELVAPEERACVEEEAQCIVEAFQEELTKPFINDPLNPSTHVAFELSSPQSRSDKLWVLFYLLKILESDPDAYTKEIIQVAELMGYTCSKKEKKGLETAGKTWPKLLVQHLTKFSKQQLAIELQKESLAAAALPPPPAAAADLRPEGKEGEEIPPADRQPNREQPLSQQDEKEGIKLEKQTEKARRRALFEERERREAEARQREAEAKDEAETPPSATKKAGDTLSIFSKREQEEVSSIYAGNPMNAKRFAKFAMNLLRKKVGSLEGTAMRRHGDGSHQKLHFTQENGPSGGVTFRIHHGGDGHGNLRNQRDTLDRILSLNP